MFNDQANERTASSIQRYKGLGRMQKIRETTMESLRTLRQVTIDSLSGSYDRVFQC
jgi:DNA gyrase/topoisomerase IV subunit B